MKLELQGHDFLYKIEHTIRIFYPMIKIQTTLGKTDTDNFHVVTTLGTHWVRASLHRGRFEESIEESTPEGSTEKEKEFLLCKVLFLLLVKETGTIPPWGVLTGVRPVARCHALLKEGYSPTEIKEIFTNHYLATEQKANLALETMAVQDRILQRIPSNSFSLYISIPFCPTRCSYCSFVSQDIAKTRKLLPNYLELLCKEIAYTGKLTKELGLVLDTVYIGGGTPSILEADQLEQLLCTVEQSLDCSNLAEYTVEAGRPDTITAEKLKVMHHHGVNRVSINPQTLNQKVLDEIGRSHSVEDFFTAFELAQKSGIPLINTDLIAGLPLENRDEFLSGLSQIISLKPENITVHTLTIKRSSDLREKDQLSETVVDLSALLLETQERLALSGYGPYYLYRQKGTRQNQENVGYALKGTESIYNIAMMEEVQTVIGVGAGSTTKLLLPDGNLQRIFNFKFPYEYNQRFSEILHRKDQIRRYL